MARKATRKTTKRKTTGRKTTAKRKTTKKRVTARKTTRRTTKRATTKRKTAKKATKAVKKPAARKPVLKKLAKTPVKKAYNKSQVLSYIADATELSRKDISNVFECLDNLAHRHLRANSAREFTIPGLMKCTVKRKPATKARKGINPFTGEPCTFKAKPARNIVKVRPLKKLKEMAK